MGRRGPKPKPTARRVLEGNASHRPLPTAEPQYPSVEAPDDVPRELLDDPVACVEWLRVLPLLRRAGAITEGDRASLLALCQQWSRYLAAHAAVAADGMVVKSHTGYPMPNPLIGIANKALAACLKLWQEFGLTPSARTRVAATGGAPATDAFAEFDDPPPTTTAQH